MPSKTKCKHARLSREKVCYECGQFVDINAKTNKYKAKKTLQDGIWFDSRKEAERYSELKAMGVEALILQPEYELVVNDILICTYRADFAYDGPQKKIVEDSKGFKTPIYRLKKKLMQAIHNIEISEV